MMWKWIRSELQDAVVLRFIFAIITGGLLGGLLVGCPISAQPPPLVYRLIGTDRCGGGLDGEGIGSQQIAIIAEALVWRDTNTWGVPPRSLWVVAANPLEEVQTITVSTLGFFPAASRTFEIPPRDRRAINIGDALIPPAISASFGVEVVWSRFGAVTAISWDAGYQVPVYPPVALACKEAWRNPYGDYSR